MELLIDPKENIGRQVCATIGIFDGVHLGHISIIDQVKKEAGKSGLSSCVITFNPHPRLLRLLNKSSCPDMHSPL